MWPCKTLCLRFLWASKVPAVQGLGSLVKRVDEEKFSSPTPPSFAPSSHEHSREVLSMGPKAAGKAGKAAGRAGKAAGKRKAKEEVEEGAIFPWKLRPLGPRAALGLPCAKPNQLPREGHAGRACP